MVAPGARRAALLLLRWGPAEGYLTADSPEARPQRPRGDRPGCWVTWLPGPADLRTLKRDLARGEGCLEPANGRRSACGQRKRSSGDQSAARSRFNVPPSPCPPFPPALWFPPPPPRLGSLRFGPSRTPSPALSGVRPRPFLAVWPAQRPVSLGLQHPAGLGPTWTASGLLERLVTVGQWSQSRGWGL